MKRVLALLLAALTFAGCGIFDGDDGKSTPPEHPATRYYPLKTGTAWAYRQVVTDSLGSQGTPVNLLRSVIGTIRRSNRTWFIVFDSSGQDSTLLRVQDNILYKLHDVTTGVARPAGTLAPAKRGGLAQLIEQEVPYINFNADQGESWRIFARTDSIQGYVISQQIDGVFAGVDAIQVPGGAFQNCLRYEITEATSIRSPIFTGSTVNDITMWLAPDVGPVRTIIEYRVEKVLKMTTLEELTSYSIPPGT